jgi:peptide-methionine (S)-S-oxide reductase
MNEGADMKTIAKSVAAVGVAGLLAFAMMVGNSARGASALPSPAVDEKPAPGATQEKVVLAGGCFWGIQDVFEHVKGVTSATSGYAGGKIKDPTYEDVSTGETGYAESVEITYDPSQVTFGQLLQIFFSVAHDPTELNRQGPDEGTQYRSVIFFETPDQERIAKAYAAQLTSVNAFRKPIVTEIVPFRGFKQAEAYHQDYALHNPMEPYIMINDAPKVSNLKKTFPTLYVNYPRKKS